MEKIIIACIILHNMIIVDEWDDANLDQRYLKEDDDFVVDEVQRGSREDSQLIANHISTVRREYMSYEDHMHLKADLVEHLRDLKVIKYVCMQRGNVRDGTSWSDVRAAGYSTYT